MKEGYIIREQEKAHFITATVVDWIDVFTRQLYRDIVIDSLKYCIENKGLILYGYVIMSNHIHMIIQSNDGKLSNLVRDFKKYTANKILDSIQNEPESRREWMLDSFKKATATHSRNKNYQFWQYGNHAEEIYSSKFMWSKLNYVHMNPVRAGIVERASQYRYSSASNYVESKGLVDVELVDNPVTDVLKPYSFLNYNQC
ncbi:hypothetical protein KCTC52924_01723 [Arenibacter antarcticus]|uniref:Transposase n=1 Tax=Arenibacter antarcticus TaxID=2040469 RepID=A0ABW5VLF6_9FLAO|nr:transposase [Arenibacter sp. H213]MCM4166869.1 transposase [Arenibacter sp. H213]